MPLLFSLVKNYETNFEDNTLRRVFFLRLIFKFKTKNKRLEIYALIFYNFSDI